MNDPDLQKLAAHRAELLVLFKKLYAHTPSMQPVLREAEEVYTSHIPKMIAANENIDLINTIHEHSQKVTAKLLHGIEKLRLTPEHLEIIGRIKIAVQKEMSFIDTCMDGDNNAELARFLEFMTVLKRAKPIVYKRCHPIITQLTEAIKAKHEYTRNGKYSAATVETHINKCDNLLRNLLEMM